MLNSDFPKISIVTPSFNQGKYLEETILSVINQEYPNLEYIIIDGGSTDNSLEIIAKYEKYLTFWVSEPDNGQSNAINKGLAKSTGEVFNWLCSDDTLTEGSLYRIGKAFKEHPEIKCYSGGLRQFQEDRTLGIYPPLLQGSFENTVRMRIVKQPSVFFGMDAIKKMGILNEALHYVMDIDWLLKFLFIFGQEKIHEENDFIVANYRLHENSKTGSTSNRFTQEYFSLLYSIAIKKNMSNYTRLIEMKQIEKNIDFPVGIIDKVNDKIIEHLLFWHCLRISGMIYNKTDFLFAKKFIREIDFSEINLFEQELSYVDFLNRYVKGNLWCRYKLQRMFQWHINKKYLGPEKAV